VPCGVCPGFPVKGCDGPITPGSSCTANASGHVCLGQVTMQFSCPLTDLDTANWTQQWALGPQWSGHATGWGRPGQSTAGLRGAHLISATGNFDVHCQVCGVKYDLVDGDVRPGYAQVEITWGPNTYQGEFNESIIRSYAIFQVDADRGQVCSQGSDQHSHDLTHVDLQQALKEVPKRSNQALAPDGSASECMCRNDIYSTQVSWQLPDGVSAVRLMVSPVTTEGEVLPLGLTTGIVQDVLPTTTTAKAGATTTVAKLMPKSRIVGNIVMKVENVQAFISDPVVKQGIKNSVASMAGVPASYVTVTLTAARRLRGLNDEADERRLQTAGSVNVEFTIDIPAGASTSASSVQNSIASTQPAVFKNLVNNKLAILGSSQVIESVAQIEAKEVPVGPPEPLARSVNQDDEGKDGARIAGIVVGVLAAACCCCGMLGAGIWYYRKKQQGPVEIEVQPRTVNVLPGHELQQPRTGQTPASDPQVLPGVVAAST